VFNEFVGHDVFLYADGQVESLKVYILTEIGPRFRQVVF